MKVGEAMSKRRSIRKFKAEPVPRRLVEEMLEAATLAPSGKNAQPWEFIVLEGEEKDEIADLVIAGAAKVEEMGYNSGSARNSARIMKESQVVIMVYNPHLEAKDALSGVEKIMWTVDIQSVGAAIQNMLLKATELGLGSLWICDVFYAQAEISARLGRRDELVAAVALGWPDEDPSPRPRRPWREATSWI